MEENDFGFRPDLPENVRDIFMWLCQDLASLCYKWKTYRNLFKPENEAILYNTAQQAFKVIEESLRVDMTMMICRLGDPLRSCGKENLNFKALEHCYENDTDLKKLVKGFQDACEPIKTHRNKLVAHSDMQTRLKPDENLMPPVGRSEIETVIDCATKVLNHIEPNMGFVPYDFMGADTLVFWLQKGWDDHHR